MRTIAGHPANAVNKYASVGWAKQPSIEFASHDLRKLHVNPEPGQRQFVDKRNLWMTIFGKQ